MCVYTHVVLFVNPSWGFHVKVWRERGIVWICKCHNQVFLLFPSCCVVGKVRCAPGKCWELSTQYFPEFLPVVPELDLHSSKLN